MPDNACHGVGAAFAATDTPNGLGDAEVSRTTLSVADAARDASVAVEAEQAKQDRLADGISAAMQQSAEAAPPAEATADQTKQIRRMANRIVRDLVPVAEQGVINRIAGAQPLLDFVAGTTAAASNFWMNFKNAVYTAVTNNKGRFQHWLGVFGKMDGVDTWMNQIVDSFQSIQPILQQFRKQFKASEESFVKECLPFANKIGMSARDFALAIGHYATARHAEEANRHIVQQWRSRIQQAVDKYNRSKKTDMDAFRLRDEVEKLQEQIDTHEQYIEMSLDDLDEGEAGGLLTCGYTNEDARRTMDRILGELDLSREDAEMLADHLGERFTEILSTRAREGVIDPAILQTFPDFEHYVPMLARSSLDGYSNTSSAVNDVTAYNPGTYHAMKGRVGIVPDSAFATLEFYGRRASMEIASKEFGMALDGLASHLREQGVTDSGLHVYDYNRLIGAINGNDSSIRRAADKLMQGGGFVVDIPTSKGFKKKFFTFDDEKWTTRNAQFDGSLLNRALSSDFSMSDAAGPFGALGRLSSIGGMMVTRFTPIFAPRAMFLDFWERGLNMPNRSFTMPDGSRLDGSAVLPRFIANGPQAGNLLYRGIRGLLDPSTGEGQLYQEFMDNGLAQAFTQRTITGDKPLDEILQGENATLKRLGLSDPKVNRFLNNAGQAKAAVINRLDQWNDYFQNMSAFTEYYTLRKMGVDANQAAFAVRKEMNLAQRGEMAPYLAVLAPFVGPTAQSGTAMLRTLGLGADNIRDIPRKGAKGFVTLAAAAGAYAALMGIAQDSLGYDDNGFSRFDALSLDEATRNLPIAIDNEGNYFRFPVGYGIAQMGTLLAVGFDRVSKGIMSPNDLMFEFLFAAIKNMSPGDWPEWPATQDPAKYVMTLLTPYALKPLMETVSNTNFMGNEIYTEPREQWQSRSELGRTTTNRRYQSEARAMQKYLGVDLQPEVYRHWEKAFFTGPLRMITLLADQADDVYRGSQMETALQSVPPPIAALGITCFYNRTNNAARTLYYSMKDYYFDRIRSEGIQFGRAPDGMTMDDHRRQVLADHGWDKGAIDDVMSIFKAEKQLSDIGGQWNATWRERWKALDSSQELRDGIMRLGSDVDDVHISVVNNSSYYDNGKTRQ